MARKSPQACSSMKELRQEIDQIDADLIGLLVERAGYIDRAIELKIIENLPARTTDRVKDVISKVRASAGQQGLDEDLAEEIWMFLIEWSIQREDRVLSS